MIRVTVELLPLGDASKAQHLGTATIANDVTGTKTKGNYTVLLSKWGAPTRTWRKGHVEGFERQKQGAWDLLLYALKSALGSRESENVKTSFVPYVEEPEWKFAPEGCAFCVVDCDGKASWANQEPTVIAGRWTVRHEDGGKLFPAGFVDLPLGVDYRICKWKRPGEEVKKRIDMLQRFGKRIVS